MKKIDSKAFLIFVKIFLVYIFLEYVLINLDWGQNYAYIIKFLGDVLTFVFAVMTLIRVKKFRLYKEQKLSLIILFFGIALLSTIENQTGVINLLLGVRSLFRYYVFYFLSYYYEFKDSDFRKISDFLVVTFYFEVILFFISLTIFQTTYVLNQNYLVQAIYLNLIGSLVLFRNKFNPKNISIIVLLVTQAFLSTSRLALIGLIVQIMLFVFILWRQDWRMKITLSTALVILLVLIFISPLHETISQTQQYEKISNLRFEASENSNFRLYLFYHFTRHSIENINLLGDGPNTFGSLYTKEFNPGYYSKYGFTDYMIAFAADSDYTVLLMQYGFVGMIAYYIILFIFYIKTPRKYKPLFSMYLMFIFFASFAIPVFSMRFSSFIIFVLFGITHNINNARETIGGWNGLVRGESD